ncbi:MAG: hypothetical protein WA045_03530 [Nitrospira sp.]
MRRTSLKSDVARIDRLKDRDIDYSEIPPLDPSFFTKATATMRRNEGGARHHPRQAECG